MRLGRLLKGSLTPEQSPGSFSCKTNCEPFRTEDYIAKLTTMAEELREVCVIVDDGELLLIALNDLDESYDPFVTA